MLTTIIIKEEWIMHGKGNKLVAGFKHLPAPKAPQKSLAQSPHRSAETGRDLRH